MFAIERNGRLSATGYILNFLIALSCLGTLTYPLLDAGGVINVDCIFRTVTGLPCPTCGYSTAVGFALSGELLESFLHNPACIIWIVLQLGLVYIGIGSIIRGRQVMIPVKLVIALAVILLLSWVFKFIAGPVYY